MIKAQTLMIQITVAVMIFIGMICSACTITVKNADDDKSPRITKTYDLKDFHTISLAGSGEIVFKQGPEYSVTAEATEATFQKLEIKNIDGELQIKQNSRRDNNKIIIGSHTSKYRVVVTAPSLSAFEMAGAGNFNCDSLQTEKFRISIAGSGDIRINKLMAKALNTEIAGSGDVDLGMHNVEYASFSIAGSGDINTNMKDCGKISVSIAGSGDVNLKGNCQSFEKKVLGSGDINTENLIINGK